MRGQNWRCSIFNFFQSWSCNVCKTQWVWQFYVLVLEFRQICPIRNCVVEIGSCITDYSYTVNANYFIISRMQWYRKLLYNSMPSVVYKGNFNFLFTIDWNLINSYQRTLFNQLNPRYNTESSTFVTSFLGDRKSTTYFFDRCLETYAHM